MSGKNNANKRTTKGTLSHGQLSPAQVAMALDPDLNILSALREEADKQVAGSSREDAQDSLLTEKLVALLFPPSTQNPGAPSPLSLEQKTDMARYLFDFQRWRREAGLGPSHDPPAADSGAVVGAVASAAPKPKKTGKKKQQKLAAVLGTGK